MKKALLLVTLLGVVVFFVGYYYGIWERLGVFTKQSIHGKVWETEVEKQQSLYSRGADVVFLGDSHMEQCEWGEIFVNHKVANRGIPGETTDGLRHRINMAISDSTQVVFLQIGTNDILQNFEKEAIASNYDTILKILSEKVKWIFVTPPFPSRYNHTGNDLLSELLPELTAIAKKNGAGVISNGWVFDHNRMAKKFSRDGIHLNAAGYLKWSHQIDSCLRTIPELAADYR